MITRNKHKYSALVMCNILGLSRQTYYYKVKPKKDEAALEEAVTEEFMKSWKVYGTRKIK